MPILPNGLQNVLSCIDNWRAINIATDALPVANHAAQRYVEAQDVERRTSLRLTVTLQQFVTPAQAKLSKNSRSFKAC